MRRACSKDDLPLGTFQWLLVSGRVWTLREACPGVFSGLWDAISLCACDDGVGDTYILSCMLDGFDPVWHCWECSVTRLE